MRLWREGWSDTRGAVMVMGVIFAALLVGILWHLVGVGDAIIYRERMQEASDSTAYESAVWHARTMNLLVVLNIIMSAILAVLVMWRTLEVLVFVAAVVTGLLALIPFMEWMEVLSEAAFNLEERMLIRDPKIAEGVEKWLFRVNKAEKMISTWAPLLDIGQPSLVNTAYYGSSGQSVNLTFPASLSLLPSVESAAQGAYFPPRMNMSQALPAMPVQEEGYWKLCQKAGEFVPTQIGALLKRAHMGKAGDAVAKVGKWFGKITGSVPGFFCGSLNKPDGVDDAIKEAATKKCDSDEQEYNTANSKDGKKPDKKFDRDKCMEDAKKKAKFQKSQISNKPAKTWDIANNGGLFFQVWSFSYGEPRWSYSDDPGVALANGQSGPQGMGDEMNFHWSMAEAEYYYNTTEAWSSVMGESMWNIKWKARLRRLHDPVRMFDGAWFVSGWVTNGINKYVTDAIKAKFKDPGLNWLKQSSFDTWWSNTYFKSNVRRVSTTITYGAGMDNLGNWVMDRFQGSGRGPLIH